MCDDDLTDRQLRVLYRARKAWVTFTVYLISLLICLHFVQLNDQISPAG